LNRLPMHGAHLRIAYTKGKEEKTIKAELKNTCHMSHFIWELSLVLVFFC